MSIHHRFIQIPALGLLLAGAYLVLFPSSSGAATPVDEVDPVTVEPAKVSAELKGEPGVPTTVEKPKPAATKNDNQLKLPDGSTVPVLNGAYGAPPLEWPQDRPWSPIVDRTMGKDGVEWYVHQDGSMSTTQNVFHSHINKRAPVTTVANPTKPLAMAPDEIEGMEKEKAGKAGNKAGGAEPPGGKKGPEKE